MHDVTAECARLRAVLAEVIERQETERSELAGDLQHDLAQPLTALKCHLEVLRREPAVPQEAIGAACELVDELVAWIRRLSLRLRPSMLDDLGLLPTLAWYVEHFGEQTGVRVSLQHYGLDGGFHPALETAAFRIVQELLANAADHAGVDTATLRVWGQGACLGLQVEDQGVGFVADESLLDAGHHGLSRVYERVSWLGGAMDVESEPGRGATVTVRLPLDLGTGEEGRADEEGADCPGR